jgi:hypothetical protein
MCYTGPRMATWRQVNIRLSEEDVARLDALVAEANEQARHFGLPDVLTASDLVRHWVKQRLGSASCEEPTKQLRPAPHLLKSQEVLRGGKKQ